MRGLHAFAVHCSVECEHLLAAPVALVQCKAWRSPVKVETVRASGGSMHAKRVQRGVFWSLAGFVGQPVSRSGTTPPKLVFSYWTAPALSSGSGHLIRTSRPPCWQGHLKVTIARRRVSLVA
ncbi:restriction endonuclease [Cupriavidus sp. DL-D2]|uniref:restriction endonuclease n=1 Tax=Cupriavidus sp. DL-D2 TaxID=3144974 RepID=UPI0032147749